MSAQEPNEPKNAEAQAGSIREDQAIHSQQASQEQSGQTRRLVEQMSRSERGMLSATRVMAAFTIVLAVLAALQAYSFIESERAFIVLHDLRFAYGDPKSAESKRDFILVFKNVGKHMSKIGKMEAAAIYGIRKKDLREILADGRPKLAIFTIPPIPPNSENNNYVMAAKGGALSIDEDAFVAGLRDGSIPLWFYGSIEYDTGYFSFRSGKLGFCMKYIPAAERKPTQGQFITCDYPEYTYAQ